MSVAHAKALLQGMPVMEKPFTPIEDARHLHRLALWAQRFTPVVSVDEPDGLLLDVAGCEHLYGGDQRMVAHIEALLAHGGLSARLALAPTVGGAWAVARFGKERITLVAPEQISAELAALPLGGLRLDPTLVVALNEVGIERIGSLLDVPRGELACRFGPNLLRRLDQALGQAAEMITPVHPASPIEVGRTFDGPLQKLEAVTATVRELLFTLVLQLEERQCGVRTLDVVFQRISSAPCRISIVLTHPSRDVRHLWILLRPKVERVHLGYGVESISLHASQFGKRVTVQRSFCNAAHDNGNQPDPSVLGAFLDRLMDRLGRRAVCRMNTVETHVPEEAYSFREWSEMRENTKRKLHCGNLHASAERMDRPSQLFGVPESAQVISLVPDGPPSWICWRGQECTVRRACGPERLALPWWEAKRGGSPSAIVARDYYEVQDDQGRILWVFRDRATNGWFVHGLWA